MFQHVSHVDVAGTREVKLRIELLSFFCALYW